jgi:transcriptional regulator with XRE-family HTH domain
MNIGKSIKLAKVKNEINYEQLAELIGLSRAQVAALSAKPHASCKNIERLAKAFNMKPSEFIALGETK